MILFLIIIIIIPLLFIVIIIPLLMMIPLMMTIPCDDNVPTLLPLLPCIIDGRKETDIYSDIQYSIILTNTHYIHAHYILSYICLSLSLSLNPSEKQVISTFPQVNQWCSVLSHTATYSLHSTHTPPPGEKQVSDSDGRSVISPKSVC